MNIPEVKTEMKSPVRTNGHTVVQQTAKPFAEQSGVQQHYSVAKLEKTEAAREAKTTLDKDRVQQAAETAESELAAKNLKLKFNIIEESKTIQVEVLDADNKVIKKIPADDVVKLAKAIRKQFPGSFVDKTF